MNDETDDDGFPVLANPVWSGNPMIDKAMAMIQLADAVEITDNIKAKDMLLAAMDNLLYTITPRRGELVEFKGGTR